MLDNKKNILLGVLVVGVIAMTVAFAALSTNLRISGTASIPNVNWNIHFVSQSWVSDTQNKVTVGTNEQDNTAEFPTVEQLQKSLSPNITLVEGLNVTLKQPGDYVKYKFNIINEGTIDAELSSFNAPMTCTSGSGCSDVINYEVKCYYNQDLTGNELTTHSVLNKNGGLAYCYLKVEYKDKTNQNSGTAGNAQTYSQDPITASLGASWQWIQKTENGQSGSNSGYEQGNNEPVTPSNPYATTFDGTYRYFWSSSDATNEGYDEGQIYNDWFPLYNSLNPAAHSYLRYDLSTEEIELCVVLGSGQTDTVCLKYDDDRYYDDVVYNELENEYYLKPGYLSSKKDELESKGLNCSVDSDKPLYCTDDDSNLILAVYESGETVIDGVYCYIDAGNYPSCY